MVRQQGAAVLNFVCIQLHSLNMSTAKTDRSRSRIGLIYTHSRRFFNSLLSNWQIEQEKFSKR